MPESLNDLAPWPQTEAEVTFETLGKSIAVYAWARAQRIHGMPRVDETYHAELNTLIYEFGTVRLLQFLADFHRDVADDAAKAVWSNWEGGAEIDECLWTWLTRWNIDHDEVVRLAEKARADRAAAREDDGDDEANEAAFEQVTRDG